MKDPYGLKQLKKAIQRFDPPLQSVALLAYEMSMVPSLQTMALCDAWAEALRIVADAVETDYGSRRQPGVSGYMEATLGCGPGGHRHGA